MTAKYIYKSQKLDQFVEDIDNLGGIMHENSKDLISGFSLEFETSVNETLDPFSEEYFSQQIALYKEISGRELDQSSGEMTEVPRHIFTPNPYGSRDPNFILQHTNAVTKAMLLANIQEGDKILDLGCGWGLSTETIGFSGVGIHAIDINPNFISLVNERCSERHIDITTTVSNFDNFETDQLYDIAFFYECLHHSIKPWKTIQHIAKFLTDDARIVFAGEPINETWPNWGVRLDALSIYCIRKFGWFESGWSPRFIKKCFSFVGWDLKLHPNIGLRGTDIGCAVRKSQSHLNPELALGREESHKISREDVYEAYKWILNRKPESFDIVEFWIKKGLSPNELRLSLLQSKELGNTIDFR